MSNRLNGNSYDISVSFYGQSNSNTLKVQQILWYGIKTRLAFYKQRAKAETLNEPLDIKVFCDIYPATRG